MTLTAQKIFDKAVHYLERYGSSAENLRRVLLRGLKRREIKFHDVPAEAPQWVDQAVEKCLRLNLVNDALYAEARVASLRRQGRSKNYIQRTLMQKGVDRKTVSQFLSDDAEDEETAAKRYAQKKRLGVFGGGKKGIDAQRKDLAKMLRAGFSMNVAKKALRSDVETDDIFDE